MTSDRSKNNNNRKCPKCSSNMIKHPSMLSMPLTSLEPQFTADTTKKSMNINIIEDQDANYLFLFHSWTKCEYTELYLPNKKGKRI